MRIKVGVVLETMWGDPGKAPGWFRINPNNHSGRRLHKLIGHPDFWVTNACKEQVSGPNEHGVPDPRWLLKNLSRVKADLLLVCGGVAKKTYFKCGHNQEGSILFIPHPAARTWTKLGIELVRAQIQRIPIDAKLYEATDVLRNNQTT